MDATAPLTLTPREPVPVRFSGCRAREGALALGQVNILQWMAEAPERFDATIGGPFLVPDGTRVADLVECVAALVTRHEGLRTTFLSGAEPRQRVLAAGALTIEQYAIGPRPPSAEECFALAEQLGERWRPGTACRPDQLPLWVALATRADLVYAAHFRISHLVVDHHAVQVLGGELAEMLADPAARRPGGSRHQPLDQVAWENTPRFQQRVERTLSRYEQTLRRMPPCPYPASRNGSGPDPTSGSLAVELASVAAALALRRVAARTRLSRPSIVLAAVCALLAQRTGYPDLVFATLVANRFDPRLTDYMGTLVQVTLVAVELGLVGFDELVLRVSAALLRAGQHGMYEVARTKAVEQRVEHEQGVRFAFEPLFNSPTVDLSDEPAPLPSPGQVRAALPATTLRHEPMRRSHTLLRFDLAEYHELMRLSLWSGDTALVPAGEAEALLRATERLLVAAADGPLDPAQTRQALALAPLDHGPGWLRVDSWWVELAEVQRLLDDALAPAVAQIFPRIDGRLLVAYVAATESVGTPAQAHARCLAALPGRHTAMAPRHYVLCAGAPADPADPAGWPPALAAGSGRDPLPC